MVGKQSLSKLALKKRQSGNNHEAIRLFREHLCHYPDDLYSKHNLAAALGDVGHFGESAQVIYEAINKGLNKHQSWLVYARSLSGIGRVKEAKSAYKSALAIEPVDGESHRELAQLIWMTTGDYENSLSLLNKSITNHPKAVNLSILRAELAGQMGDYASQHKWMLACYESFGQQPEIKYYLSKAALANGAFQEALKFSKLAITAFHGDLQCVIHHINCLLANALPETALALLEQVIKRFPHDQHLLALQATCWRLQGDDRYEQLYNYEQYVRQLPLGVPDGWDDLNHYIDDLETELDEEHHFKSHPFFLSVRHGSQIPSITSSSRTAMKAFSEAVKEPMDRYLRELEGTEGYLQSRNKRVANLFSAWSVKLFSDGFHVNHVHQEGWLSSACHIRLADFTNTSRSETDREGWLKFGEPGPVCKPQLLPDKYIEPKRGHIVIFPSYIWHGTVPIKGKADRLTVAADFVPS